MCLIDYRGYRYLVVIPTFDLLTDFRVIAMSVLPITKKTIVYGTSDGGVTVHNTNEELSNVMKQNAGLLNIKSHVVGKAGTVVHSAADIEGKISSARRKFLPC